MRHHITFATANFSQPVHLLQRSVRRFGIFSERYSDTSPVVLDLCKRFPEIMSKPLGFGYWLWKPAIILDAMRRLNDGDVLLYTDADMTMIADPAPLFAATERNPIMVFECLPPGVFLMKHYTKRDCFVLLGADEPRFWNTPQLYASIQLYRVCDRSRAFVAEVLNASSDPRVLTDAPNTCGKPNFEGYVGHREDQSILTILARQHGLPFFPDPSQMRWGRPSDDAVADIERPTVQYATTFNIHHKRNRDLPTYLVKRFLTRQYTGGRFWI